MEICTPLYKLYIIKLGRVKDKMYTYFLLCIFLLTIHDTFVEQKYLSKF